LNDHSISTPLADPLRVLTAREVALVLGLHPITVWKWQATGKLPRPIKLARNETVWRAPDIAAWLDQKAQETAQQRLARKRDGSASKPRIAQPRWKPSGE
jgi:predicted DNA-binding transcriptional regulator AlpA